MPSSSGTSSARQHKLQYQDYVLFPADGRRHEIIDGTHIMNPAPETYHQTLSGRLFIQLFMAIDRPGLGHVFYAPVDVQLSAHDVVQPDLVVILKANEGIITRSRVQGVPDLVIEIISTSSRKLDQTLKRALYERYRVPEYWIVDPKARQVSQHILTAEGTFAGAVQCSREITFHGAGQSMVSCLTDVW